jgi:hypothetical protein
MIRTILAFVGFAALAACGPRTISLTDGQCPEVRIGDRVEGVAILHAYTGDVCIECGASLSRPGCAGEIGYRNANDQVDADYRRIILQLPPDGDNDFVRGRVFVSGTIINMNGANGSPLLNADVIRRPDN